MTVYADLLSVCASRVDRLRNDVGAADARILRRDAREHIYLATRGWAYVGAAAALERLLIRVLEELFDELTALAVQKTHIRVSLLTACAAPAFQSARDSRGLPRLERQCAVLYEVLSTDLASLPRTEIPLDGRTPRRGHLETIWSVVGLEGAPLPGLVHGVGLAELAELRNQIAHGESTAYDIGRLKTVRDVLRILEIVDEVALHFVMAVESYLLKHLYLR